MKETRRIPPPPCNPRTLVLASALLLGSACGSDPLAEMVSTTMQGLNTSPKVSDFLLYAEHRLTLGRGDMVLGGDIGVRTALAPSASSQMQIGDDTYVEPQRNLLAPSVSLGRHAEVGDVQTNALANNGGRLHTLSPFPAAAMPAPLLAPSAPLGSNDVSVDHFGRVTLPPGNYGALKVEGTLILKPGTYSFASVVLSDGARLLAQPGGTDVRVAGTLDIGCAATVIPLLTDRFMDDDGRDDELLHGFSVDASQLRLSVLGSDSTSATPVARIGERSHITALVAAPHGTVAIGDGATATGAFTAFDISVGDHAALLFSTGFSALAPSQHGQQQLTGYFGVQPDPSITPLVGPVPVDTVITLSFGLPIRDLPGLTTFVKQASDPTNPNYGNFLSQAQFAATYGATAADYQSLIDWASSTAGLTVATTYPNNLLLRVTGTVAQFEQALYTNLVYRLRQDGSQFISVDRDPSLDLTVPILEISGLNSYYVPQITGGSGANSRFRAFDFRVAYLGLASDCMNLDGSGQVVGIIDFDPYKQSDIAGYDALQIPALNPANVSLAVSDGSTTSIPNSPQETTTDIELVQAMAPGAQILVFQDTGGLSGHVDGALHSMATSTPPLTVASSSLGFKAGDNAQQALLEMAAQGVSFFNASGDFGNVGDPQGNFDMNYLTLVGGTSLQTKNLSSLPPDPLYPSPYYVSESTWNQGQMPGMPAQDATGGGIMNGTNLNGNCYCNPAPLCCSSGVPIPYYQANVNMATNGGSTTFRNYPDVAMVALGIDSFFNGTTGPWRGTSAAAPLWAGFTALANQARKQNGKGTLGFLNPAIYNIGLTRGTANDLYATCFNDISDNGNNFDQRGPGFTTVAGYDLTTGWGSPTCQLIKQLATPAPLTPPNQALSLIEFSIDTGSDDLRGNGNGCGTGATATVLLAGGGSFTVPLHSTTDPNGFDNNTSTIPPLVFPVPNTVNPPLTSAQGIVGVTLSIQEHYSFPCTADNWDITHLSVSLFNPGGPNICQINLAGGTTLQDGSTGLVRLSENADSSGVGPSMMFAAGASSGCP